MALRLLNPSQAAFETQKKTERDSSRALEVQKLLVEKYKELAKVEKDFETALLNNRNKWAGEEQEHINRILIFTNEIQRLEVRKRDALVPLTTRQRELDTIASGLALREDALAKKEAEIEELRILLTIRLDELSEREIQADMQAKTLQLKQEGITLQAAQVKQGSEALTKAITNTSQENSGIQRRLALREEALVTRETHLAEREQKVVDKDKLFGERERALNDKYKTLERSIKRIKNG